MFYNKPLTTISYLITLFYCSSSLAALSATSLSTIKGTQPYLQLLNDEGKAGDKLQQLKQVMGIEYWDGTLDAQGNKHYQFITADDSSNLINSIVGMKLSDVKALVAADGVAYSVPNLGVGDDDNDASPTENSHILGTVTATWFENGVKITDLNHKLSSCDHPYQLKIEMKDIKASTTYGDPNEKDYGNNTVTYSFVGHEQGLCYLRPLSMHVYNQAHWIKKFEDGYNSAAWVPGQSYSGEGVGRTQKGGGFKKSAGFPTTGFKGAEFSLIGAGDDQSIYRCSTTSTDVELLTTIANGQQTGSNCTVRLTGNAKPKSDIVINMEYHIGNDWLLLDTYKVSASQITKWALIQNNLSSYMDDVLFKATRFDTLDQCRKVLDGTLTSQTTNEQATSTSNEAMAFRQKYLYRRDELSNSPYNDRTKYPEMGDPKITDNVFSRDVDHTFSGEWGYLNYYKSSNWSLSSWYWTSEIHSMSYQYGSGTDGNIDYNYRYVTGTNGVICRGDNL